MKIEDYIFDVSNTSITHRPDLWCHRGCAREIAALLDLPFKPLEDFIASKVIKNTIQESLPSPDNPYTTRIENPEACPRFASLYFDFVEQHPSLIWMAQRLARIDCKPINSTVDLTNYVLFDIGQPLHAYDAKKLESKCLSARNGRAKETITLLDNEKVELMPEDLVIADGEKPVALAGIMGGQDSGINMNTKSIVLESACFNPSVIRNTSMRLGIRTESSIRFEKSLDPNLNVLGILRFLRLLDDAKINAQVADIINSIGERAQDHEITITHKCIEQRLGIHISPDFVRNTLEKLGFHVTHDAYAVQLTYIITVSTFRGTKDVKNKEDIVEEVGRFFGYDNIPPVLPERKMDYFIIRPTVQLRAIKQVLASDLEMHEICNYSLFDESFLPSLQWEPEHAVTIKNPVSENWQRMVTSLIPGLLKTIDTNKNEYNSMRFFEWARIWQLDSTITEQKSLAGIFFDQKNPVNFYDAKVMLHKLFHLLDLSISWEKVEKPQQPWYTPYQTAYLVHHGKKIGIAGKSNCAFLSHITEGDAFIFELDADFLVNYKPATKIFEPTAKYPGIDRDVSIFVPAQYTADEIIQNIENVSPLIVSVSLVDFFVKEERPDKRALTFHCLIQNPNKTLTSQEADTIWQNVIKTLEQLGATIR